MLALLVMVLTPLKGRASLAQDDNSHLFIDTMLPTGMAFSADPAFIRARAVTVNFGQLSRAPGFLGDRAFPHIPLRLNLFDDVSPVGILDRVEPAVPDGVTWIGRVEGEEPSEVILVVRDCVIAGHIRTRDEIYEVRYLGDGVHAIYQIDPCALPPGAEPVRVEAPAAISGDAASMEESGSIIDILVVYTQTAREMNGGTAGIEAAINLEVEMTNNAYANSQVTQRLNLVHMGEVNYTESSNSSYDLANLQGGWIDDVHALRETYRADLVSMFVYSLDVGGVGYLMDSSLLGPAFAPYAYSVVKMAGADTNYAFAHELGHNMGCQHDRANVYGSSTQGAYPYSYGYQDPGGAFHTIMAYWFGCPVSCPVIPYFSNPDISYMGKATGVDYLAPDSADNARTLNNTAPIVANFRNGTPAQSLSVILSSSSPAVGNVLTVDVTVQPISQRFDAWGVIVGPGGKIYSFVLGKPGKLQKGMKPLARNVSGLRSVYTRTLLSMKIPQGAGGSYTIIVGLVPAKKSPSVRNAIPNYLDQKKVTVY
jgi:peptidyl-Asp metalloendopeptidase